MLVKDIMTSSVVTISEQASLKEAGRLLKEKRISGLPVVNQSGNLIGVITLNDLFKILDQVYKHHPSCKDIKLGDIFNETTVRGDVYGVMTKEVHTLNEDDDLSRIMEYMFIHKVHTIPVLREGKLIGVVGRRDIIYACF